MFFTLISVSLTSSFAATTMAVDFVGIFQLNNHDFSISSDLKQAVSALSRSGHARFRRAPPSDPQSPSVSSRSEDKVSNKDGCLKRSVTDATASFQSPASSFAGGSVEGSVSNCRQLSSLGVVAPAPSFSSRKPPLPSSHRKRHSVEMKALTGELSAFIPLHPCSGNPCFCKSSENPPTFETKSENSEDPTNKSENGEDPTKKAENGSRKGFKNLVNKAGYYAINASISKFIEYLASIMS